MGGGKRAGVTGSLIPLSPRSNQQPPAEKAPCSFGVPMIMPYTSAPYTSVPNCLQGTRKGQMTWASQVPPAQVISLSEFFKSYHSIRDWADPGKSPKFC